MLRKPVIIHEPKSTEVWRSFDTVEAARQELESWVGDEYDVKAIFTHENGRKLPVGIYWMGQYYPVGAPDMLRYAVISFIEFGGEILHVHRSDTLESARQWIIENKKDVGRYYIEIVDGEVFPIAGRVIVERYDHMKPIE